MAGFGGGEGLNGTGGGGLGAGGAIFIQEGGSLTIASGVSETGNSASGGSSSGEDGYGLGGGIFAQGNSTLTFAPAAGTTDVIGDAIADVTGAAPGTGATGQVGVLMNGAGTLDLAGNDAYSGTTTIASGTLELSGDESGLTGAIVDDSHLVLDPASVAALPPRLFPAGDQVTLVVAGQGFPPSPSAALAAFADFVAALNAQGAPLLAAIGPISAGTDSIGFNRESTPGESMSAQFQIYDSDGILGQDFQLSAGPTGLIQLAPIAGVQTFSQTLSGTGDVTVDGGADVVLAGAADWTGGTTIAAGSSLTLSTVPSGVIDNAGSLIFDNTAPITINPADLINTGTVTFAGAAVTFTTPLTGSGTYVFDRQIETLRVDAEAGFNGSISGLLPGDTIIATGFQASSFTETVTPSNGLVLSDAQGDMVDIQLDAGSDPSQLTFTNKVRQRRRHHLGRLGTTDDHRRGPRQ